MNVEKVEPGGDGGEELEEGVDPDDELYATAPRRAVREAFPICDQIQGARKPWFL